MVKKSAEQRAWHKAQMRVIQWLRGRGFKKVRLMNYGSPFDIDCDGLRVEVKHTRWRSKVAVFNIHRHGKVDESQVDAYILVLTGIPMHRAHIYLIFKAPLNTPTIHISFRSLLNKYLKHVNNLEMLKA